LGCATKCLSADGQLDSWRLLDVFDPVAIHVRGTNVSLSPYRTNQIVTSWDFLFYGRSG